MKKICSKCKIEKDITEFEKQKQTKDGRRSYCKACKKVYRESKREEINKKLREHYKNNKGKYKEYNRQYEKTEKGKEVKKRKAHRRRAIKMQCANLGNYTLQELEECRKFFNYRCAYSGEPLKGNEEVEHIVPISKGGTNNINNIVLATKEVNSSKRANLIDEWYPKQPFYTEERYNKIKEWIKLKSQTTLFEAI